MSSGPSRRRWPSVRLSRLQPTTTWRALVFLCGDLLIWTGALWAAFLIRFDGEIPRSYLRDIPYLLALVVPVRLGWHAAYRLYHLTWRAVGLTDLLNVLKANTLASLMILGAALMLRTVDAYGDLPRSVLILDYVLSTGGVALFRVSRRGWALHRQALRMRANGGTRLLIVGAGAAGNRILQTIEESGRDLYQVVGFVDDDPGKRGAFIRGVRVLGGTDALPRLVREQGVEEILIAMPSVPASRLREIVAQARATGIQRIKVLPGVDEWLAGRATLKDIRDVNLHDLLRRAPVHIQYDALRTYYTDKRVLVTGAAGSIGAEVVRQLTRFRPALVVAADVNESALFELEQELLRARPEAPVQVMLADIRDAPKIDWVMATRRPEVVVHAAAYKHVPMMEREVEEAVKTNIFGTLTVAEAALRHGVETFVFISSDKAVNPGNVLGATKRVGELIVQAFGTRQRTRFLAVRFGNVLGSRGSLIPLMLEQIRHGGPVTITHPDMTRYFMTISEAVLLVLQTPLMTAPGSIFMLEMGSPIRVVELVRDLIRLAGLEEDRDIPIVFSGIRAGEKLQEQLVGTDEEFVPTAFDGIGEVRSARTVDEVTLRLALRELQARVEAMDSDGVRSVLRRISEAGMAVPAAAPGWAGGAARLALET